MSNDTRPLLTSASAIVATTVSVGVFFIVATHFRSTLARCIRRLFDPLGNQRIQIVTTRLQCVQATKKLIVDCQTYPVLGFDCEWVTVNGTRRPVALLQLATYTGFCALIRLNQFRDIPTELRILLEDDDIFKVGVVPEDDAKYLAHDYGLHVSGTLDLRHIAAHLALKPEGLAKMAKEHLNVVMEKNWRISCSDWEQQQLTPVQLKYAATDAHVGVTLFQKFLGYNRFYSAQHNRKEISQYRQQLDLKFKYPGDRRNLNEKSRKKGQQPNGNKSLTTTTTRSMCTRSSPLYQNCLLLAPDGELLCTCDKRKADWYVNKNLATVVAETPSYTVRLKFEPAGRAVGQVGQYYLQVKENKCVVCGETESYLRKNVIPREYRKYFPTIMKDHTSHDVLLLCPRCHQHCNGSDLHLRHKLATLCDAPFTYEKAGARLIELPNLKNLKSAAKALVRSGTAIPAERRIQLEQQVLTHYPAGTSLTPELLAEAAEIITTDVNLDYSAHGEKVVEYFRQSRSLIELERMWRQHFLDNMRPRFMPELWSVEHNVERLEIRVEENRISPDEIVESGLNACK